jgi:hypothetical protein
LSTGVIFLATGFLTGAGGFAAVDVPVWAVASLGAAGMASKTNAQAATFGFSNKMFIFKFP